MIWVFESHKITDTACSNKIRRYYLVDKTNVR